MTGQSYFLINYYVFTQLSPIAGTSTSNASTSSSSVSNLTLKSHLFYPKPTQFGSKNRIIRHCQSTKRHFFGSVEEDHRRKSEGFIKDERFSLEKRRQIKKRKAKKAICQN
jgi:hypothetical protein